MQRWEDRFQKEEYAYGIEPNKFLAQQLNHFKPGKILFGAEGEGRNAVYAAKEGWNVSAFDISTEGKNKALKLAKSNQVHIDYRVGHLPDLKFKPKYLKVLSFTTLTTALCAKHNATIIFRGLRAVSDFEYEFQLAGMNRQLNKRIETVFLMSDPDKQVISSRFVKEIAKLNGKIDNFVTKSTKKAIKEKYE